MISFRLTKTQKAEILTAYRSGDKASSIAEKYRCTTSTIHRTVKALLSDSEYTSLKEKRLRIANKKVQIVDTDNIKEKKDLELKKSLTSFSQKVKEEDLNEELDNPEPDEISVFQTKVSYKYSDISSDSNQFDQNLQEYKNIQNIDNNLELIEPLLTDVDFDQDKLKVGFKLLNFESLPEIVYMIVDKKVELDFHLISDLPEWYFLPVNELERSAILLFSNQRTAKRNCSRNQRVIKIPNTGIFKLSKPYLIAKGITRLILEDSIFALDS